MSVVEDVIIPLTVVINSENTKVLFAEVDNHFTDIFLSFLTLPLGKILGLFNKHYGEGAPVIGSLSTLYNSLESLDDVYFWTSEGKQMLLNPRSKFSDDCNNLKFNLDDSPPTKYFTCGTRHCSHTTRKRDPERIYSNRVIGLYYDSMRCKCGKLMSKEICFEKSNTVLGDEEGVFTRRYTNFTVSDDMQIGPNALGFIIQNLRNIGIADIQGTKTMTIDVRANEIMDLLKGVLLSQTPLTDFVRHKTPLNNVIEKCKTNTTLHIEQKEENSRKIVVKVVLHASTNKFLFVQAEDDFIDFLYSLLVIPLGGVAHLLGGSTCLGSVDNLYRSVASFDGKHLKTNEMKNRLLEPQLPCNYLSECQILPITELLTKVYSYRDLELGGEYVRLHASEDMPLSTIIDPKGKECYIRKPGVFIVRDDLTVTPLSTITTISLLNEMRAPLSDVEEVDMEIGVSEALGILKESLTSTSVFTNVLIKPTLNRQPKEENMFRRGIMI